METLLGPLNVNVTFDRTLDWSHSVPELLYWDIGMYVKSCIYIDHQALTQYIVVFHLQCVYMYVLSLWSLHNL